MTDGPREGGGGNLHLSGATGNCLPSPVSNPSSHIDKGKKSGMIFSGAIGRGCSSGPVAGEEEGLGQEMHPNGLFRKAAVYV